MCADVEHGQNNHPDLILVNLESGAVSEREVAKRDHADVRPS